MSAVSMRDPVANEANGSTGGAGRLDSGERQASGLPAPEEAEASPMPGDDGRRLDDHERAAPSTPDLR